MIVAECAIALLYGWSHLVAASPGSEPVQVNEISHAQFVRRARDVLAKVGHDPAWYTAYVERTDPMLAYFPDGDLPDEETVVFEPEPDEDDRTYPVLVYKRSRNWVEWVWKRDSFTEWQQAALGAAHSYLSGERHSRPIEQYDFLVTEFEDCLEIAMWVHIDRIVEPLPDGMVMFHLDGDREVNLSKTSLTRVKDCPL